MTLTTLIAIYGGGLSTVLAILKFRETWQGRFRIATLLTSGLDNQVHFTNLYNKPVTIINYDLFWAKSKNSKTDYRQIDTGSEDCCNIVLAPAETHILVFSEQYSFSIKNKTGNLYIRFILPDATNPSLNYYIHGKTDRSDTGNCGRLP